MTPTNQLEENKRIYRRYIEILNAQDFNALPQVTDTEQYKEICVGFTPGWVNLVDAVTSLKKVLQGIPNLHARIEDCVAEDNKVYARLKVTGTQKGNLFGMPATNNSYEAQMFDYATIENGKIVERIQQSDNLGQFITLFKGTFTIIGITLALIIIGLITALIIK
jgi:predicted ester cyclase